MAAGFFDHQSQTDIVPWLQTQPLKAGGTAKGCGLDQVKRADADEGAAFRLVDTGGAGGQ